MQCNVLYDDLSIMDFLKNEKKNKDVKKMSSATKFFSAVSDIVGLTDPG